MRSLVIKCTAGLEDPERCSQAFTVAATGLAAGAAVTLWLTGDAAWLASPGRAEEFDLPAAAPLAETRDLLAESGALVVCSQCAVRRGLTADDLVPGARIGGAAEFVESALAEDAQALIY